MIEVKAEVFALVASAVFLTATILGIGNDAGPAAVIPGAVRLGKTVPQALPPAEVEPVVGIAAPVTGSRPAGVTTESSASRPRGGSLGGVPGPAAEQAAGPPLAPPVAVGVSPAAPAVPVTLATPDATPPPPPPGTAATPTAPASTSETVTRPVQTGQLDDFDDDDDDNSGPSSTSGPGSGNSGSGSRGSGSGSGK